MAKQLKLTFTKEKETKGAVRFHEDGDPDSLKVRSIYLRKTTLEKMGDPTSIEVTIKPHES